jgi:hypothetical protein
MATRSTIALEYADGTVGQVYCHWDGYLEHNGMLLYKHYSNPFILRDLLDLGDVSSLGRIIGTQHPFSPHFDEGSRIAYDLAQAQGATTFYGRDRGEDGVGARKFKDFADYKANHQYEEYEYILRSVCGEAVWFVSDHDGAYVPLADALAEFLREKAEEETLEA